MKIKLLALVLSVMLLVCSLPSCALFTDESIAILYENDVHCEVDGYATLAAMKSNFSERYDHVGVVSVGDFIQGGSLGSVSQGEYIINIMNLVDYDAVALGNHEFDYKLPKLLELTKMMKTKPICANFYSLEDNSSVFEPYSIVSYGKIDIAYVGITTPSTLSSSTPTQFKNENGEYLYTFNPDSLYDIVQDSINAARKKGADYVIALSHLGTADDAENISAIELAENTRGLDVILDGHSHSVIEEMTVNDADGNEVLLSSTGTKFEHIGKLTIIDGEINTNLIKTAEYESKDEDVVAYLEEIKEEYTTLGNKKIGFSDVSLITHDTDGNRLIRNSETNLGNFCADAYRIVTGADIGYVNGGAIRAELSAGNVTFNDILNVYPFNDQVVVCQISGQVIKDMLEFATKNYPDENGAFPHVSGITFSLDESIVSSAGQDDAAAFTSVNGEYRVYDIKVLNKESGAYEPLDLNKKYTLASLDYMILEQGNGMSMLRDAEIVTNDGMLDVELLEKYIVEALGGHITKQYASIENRMNVTNGKN